MHHQERAMKPKPKEGVIPGKKAKGGKEANTADAFAFHPTFSFDSIPSVATKGEASNNGGNFLLPTPQWHQVARAPVSFGIQEFWTVLNRWIVEVPSIIPPVENVEIMQDYSTVVQDALQQQDQDQGHREPQFPHYVLLTDRGRYRRGVHRRLLPKRKDKDPVMEEAVLFYDEIDSSSRNQANTKDIEHDKSTAFAIFAPMFNSPSSLQTNTETDQTLFQTLAKSLPFYYPALRAFRYGYRQDPEDNEEGEHGEAGIGDDVEYNENNQYHQTRRAGWITLDLLLAGDEGPISNKLQYAFKELFKKLFKWGVNTTKGYVKSKVQHDVLVPKDLYVETYARLKEKHAKKWVENWPERTDAVKFVFEDIAIAAWLVALWQLEREQQQQSKEPSEQSAINKRPKLDPEVATVSVPEKQTFVDLGCGNGLLTHILNEEGHFGTGIDISSRKVWELYGSNTHLEAKALKPNETIFDNVDWIIGNHADELAPWVPIIAARSKPWTKFVVIPCCFFDLVGKYAFPHGYAEGKYKAYVDFIESMIDICGYQVEREVLRIPSTKNIALVGRVAKGGSEDSTPANVLERIDAHLQSIGASTFVPRLSDREKQQLHWSSHEASLARRSAAIVNSVSLKVVNHSSPS
ncbi:tRNA methyltransferase 44 [Actinomortierella wolfii]|nr:tRNA methyltransferase 44 [Actinomortierella wolfii]